MSHLTSVTDFIKLFREGTALDNGPADYDRALRVYEHALNLRTGCDTAQWLGYALDAGCSQVAVHARRHAEQARLDQGVPGRLDESWYRV
jgi:hypothetical protein